MTGDPKVLGPLQQAFNETDDGRVQQQIVYAWCHETGNYNIYSVIESEIRAWTPPTAEPSLEQRVAALEELKNRIDAMLFEESEPECTLCGGAGHTRDNCNPEPTAPDDPVCATCGHGESFHRSRNGSACLHSPSPHDPYCTCKEFVPAPQPAPDLDPVLLKIAEAFRTNDDWSSAGVLRRSRLRAAWAAMLDLDNALVAKDMNEYGLKDGGVVIARYGWSTSRDALHATNTRKRRSGWFTCVMATALLLLVAVTVL